MQKYLTIKEAAEYLGVSKQTLRRWDETGQLKASFVSAGGHRRYSPADLEKLAKGLYRTATEWAASVEPRAPHDEFYCATSDVFKTRLERMAREMEKNDALKDIGPIVVSVAGEIGNNSYDHNTGNWPDLMGSFFAYDLGKRIVVLADRGRGVLSTLRNTKPGLKDDYEALTTAFTEVLTGRAPEHRGNGLKFVRKAVMRFALNLKFCSGAAELEIRRNDPEFHLTASDQRIRGSLTLFEF